MLVKKNYKEQQHFSTLHTFSVVSPNGRKVQVYYKRYRPAAQANLNMYDLKNSADTSATKIEYPVDRTLELMTFDGSLSFLKKYLRKIGKIRKYELGEGMYKQSLINTAICVFKFEFDLVKCFRDDLLQTLMDNESVGNLKEVNESDREDQRIQLIQKHLGKQLAEKVDKIKEMQEGGYQVVTDIYGQYRLDMENNQKFVENLPQQKKKRKALQARKREQAIGGKASLE